MCERGRCCRRDNPDYQLPQEGDWDGPVYGQIGVLRHEEDVVECHACGETKESLVVHIARKHDLTTAEYKAIFGLNKRTPLVGIRLSGRLGEVIKARIAAGTYRGFADPDFLAAHRPTREQISHRNRQRQPRREEQRHRDEIGRPIGGTWSPEARAAATERSRMAREAALRARGVYSVEKDRVCVICQKVDRVRFWNQSQTCSWSCRAALIGLKHQGRVWKAETQQRRTESVRRYWASRRAGM